MSETLESVIREWVVKDYFTPNIKAEVILDTLLSKYIHELVEGTTLVAKEMSIPRGDLFGSIGTKIDYVLAGDKVYLIELKTTDSSDNDEQAGKYLEECQSQEKSFGDKIGRQLLSILNKKAVFNLKLGGHEHWTNETLRTAFDLILQKYGVKSQDGHCAEQAMALIREKRWTQSKKYRSRKYLYTLGKLVDYPEKLWDKQMEVIYLTPDGRRTHEGIEPRRMKKFVADLPNRHPNDELAQLLADIIAAIYLPEKAGK